MSFECAHCHEYVAGVGVDPPQFCGSCDGKKATCVTCDKEFEWPDVKCKCKQIHGEWNVRAFKTPLERMGDALEKDST